MSKSKPTIVGQYFLTFPSDKAGIKGQMQWRGEVVRQQHPGIYLVQLFDWLMGCPTATLLIRVEKMVDENWDFYERREDWAREGIRLFNLDSKL